MILLDTNVFIYAAGAKSKWKKPCGSLLRRVLAGEVDAVTDAGVLQEVLHYCRRREDVDRAVWVYDRARAVVREVLPVTAAVVDGARAILAEYRLLSPMDAIHASVCALHAIPAICTYDRHFNVVRGLRRVAPDRVG